MLKYKSSKIVVLLKCPGVSRHRASTPPVPCGRLRGGREQMSDKLRLWFVLVLTVTGATAIVAGMSGQVTTKAASLATSVDR